MTLPIDLRVLVASDGMVRTGEGELFHCLAGLNNVCHVGLDDALDRFSGEGEDGWDMVVVDCERFTGALDVIIAIQNMDPEQCVILMHPAFMRTAEFACGFYVPRDGQALREVLKRSEVGGVT